MKKTLLIFVMMLLALPMLADQGALVVDEGGTTNIRKGPGTNYGVALKIADGSFVWVDEYSNGWMRAYNSRGVYMGWISAEKVMVPPEECEFYYLGKISGTKTGRAFLRVSTDGGTDNYGTVAEGKHVLCGHTINDVTAVYNQRGKFLGYVKTYLIKRIVNRDRFFPVYY